MPASRPPPEAEHSGLRSSPEPVQSSRAAASTATGKDGQVEDLIRLSQLSNAALMRGDTDAYAALVALSSDFTLMSPFGGVPSRGPEYTPERMAAMGRFFRNGTLQVEMVEAYGSPDMVVLALVEHAHVEVGGLKAQDWNLRVTLVYRRDENGWRLVHRHADPLVEGVSLRQAADLARGVRQDAEGP
ncbi:YybH family protein [Pseudoroseomonas ludipueritiae]|uniref:Nuclear transport factor 2 family protein n=1 Tax=Pseudoroseomonas ludipueritiae TaxID=198093 RepID=A0ABR7R5X1_9PROT|nr:nuclear transport factor 2 family protein [Pseudoroseomonas ludipueritiae]